MQGLASRACAGDSSAMVHADRVKQFNPGLILHVKIVRSARNCDKS